MRFTLAQRLLFSYAAMAFFTVGALAYAVMGLNSLYSAARDIARNDLVLISMSTKMRESLLAQQRYAGRYAILKEADFADLFYRREAEFLTFLDELRRRQPGPGVERLDGLYQTYRSAAADLFRGRSVGDSALAPAAQSVLVVIDSVAALQQERLDSRLETAGQRERTTTRWMLALFLAGFLVAIGLAGFLVFSISRSIRKLQQATRRIAEGDFDHNPRIPPGNEIGDLAQDFTVMASRLKLLEQISLDASPLTRLPGNIAIERAISKRVKANEPFAVCYADLDNFKAYNDRYGYINGNEVIRKTGEIIFDVVKRLGDDNAFIGHLGGDDFVMIVTPDRIPPVCQGVIQAFDEMIPSRYSPEDRATGVLGGVDRYGVQRTFPIMTISIAVLLCQEAEFDSAIEIAKAATEIKEFVKGSPGSNYMVDRRKAVR